jgi:hypothetical protein
MVAYIIKRSKFVVYGPSVHESLAPVLDRNCLKRVIAHSVLLELSS